MERDPERMVQLLVGLPNVNVLGVDDGRESIEIHVECRHSRPGCPDCGVLAHLKDQRVVTLVDLPCFGKSTKLAWHGPVPPRWSRSTRGAQMPTECERARPGLVAVGTSSW